MSAEREILEYLANNKHTLKYKGVHVGFLGLPDFQHYKYQTMVNKSSILQEKGYVKKDKFGNYFITYKGRDFLDKKIKSTLRNFNIQKAKDAAKNLLVMYDIPQEQKKERDWFRRHLKSFGFIMIQKSVWVGPSPLPKEFVAYVKEIKLGDNFKTFKLAKGYV